MPLFPTPPKGRREEARWRMVSLTHPPPKESSRKTRRSAVRSEVNRYRARGLGRARTKAMAWSRESTVSTGRMGPKISSCMTGSSGVTPSSTVGAMRSRSGSQPPPTTTFSRSRRETRRVKCFWFMIFP